MTLAVKEVNIQRYEIKEELLLTNAQERIHPSRTLQERLCHLVNEYRAFYHPTVTSPPASY